MKSFAEDGRNMRKAGTYGVSDMFRLFLFQNDYACQNSFLRGGFGPRY